MTKPIVFSLFFLLIARIFFAAEGRIPIFQATTITVSGSYIVTDNITSASSAITINASDVSNTSGVRAWSASASSKQGIWTAIQ